MEKILIELQYFPPIAYFAAILKCKELTVEKFEHYEKQTFRNRCYINTSQGTETLIVPLTSKDNRTLIKDVRIDYQQKWLNNHWQALQSAYGKAPFFEYYADDIQNVLFKRKEFLYDLNFELLTMCLKWLKLSIEIKESTMFEKQPANAVLDLRSKINPKQPDDLYAYFTPVPYQQVFGNKFVTTTSLIDLIFCVGPGAGDIVRASVSK